MTLATAKLIRLELMKELNLQEVQLVDRDKYRIEIDMLVGGGTVTLGPEVIGGYVGRSRHIPILSTQISFDVYCNLRTAFSP